MPVNNRGRSAFIAALLLVAVHFIFIIKYFQPAISTLDSHGYHVQARQIARTGKTYIVPESRIQFIGYTWNKDKNGRYFTIWPPGFPLLLAIVYKAICPEAALLVNPVMASLSLLALFLVCRAWIGSGWGLLAAAMTAMTPFVNLHAHYGYSHISVIFFLIWGLFFLTRWIETESSVFAFVCGLLLGVIPSIRLLEGIFIPAFFVFAWLKSNRTNDIRYGLVPFLLGAAAPVTMLVIYNSLTFDTLFKSGYSLVGYNLTAIFRWDYFSRNSVALHQKLLAEGGGFTFALGTVGIFALCTRRNTWKRGLFLALLVFPITVFYMFYFYRPDPNSMRFFLPTFPIYSIAAVWLLSLLAENRRGAAAALSIAIIVLTLFWGLPQSIDKMERLERRNKAVAEITQMIAEHAEKGSVVIAPEPLCAQLDFLGRWRVVNVSKLRNRRPDEYDGVTGGTITRAFERDVRKWAGGRKVYWLMRERDINRIVRRIPKSGELTPVAWKRIPPVIYLGESRRPDDRHHPRRADDDSFRARGEFDIAEGAEYRLDLMYD
ncbi:MAG: hypothetical protein AB1546_11510, partial [bacterium]